MLWSKFKIKSMCLIAAAALTLSSCGFSPLYGQKRNQPYMDQALASIQVSRIPDHLGQKLRLEVLQRIAPKGQNIAPAYTLTINLNENLARLSIDQSAFATRANLKLHAQYTLVRKRDGHMIIEGQVSSVASFNILSSDYATLTAENNARDLAIVRIADLLHTRLAVHFKISAPDKPDAGAPNSKPNTPNYGYPN